MTTNVSDHGNDFGLMYGSQCLAEKGEEKHECIFNGSYDQLMGYVNGLKEVKMSLCLFCYVPPPPPFEKVHDVMRFVRSWFCFVWLMACH